jgi:hypothetical protein
MKRKRGGQPGNQNALKHGFYSAGFKERELRALDSGSPEGLANEIELVRVAALRYLHALDAQAPADDLDAQLSALRAFSLGAMSINGLVRTQLILSRGGLLSPETMAHLFSVEGDRTRRQYQPPHDPGHPSHRE